MKQPPQSPEELNALLVAIFPTFSGSLEELESSDAYRNGVSFHALMIEFTCFFSKGASSFSGRQLEQLSESLVLASRQPSPLENAINTCFLEHIRQIKVNKLLAPWLAKAKAKHGA
ncbi:MAG: hypothetical protein FWH15_02285 [Betaproteobacteria bacterium]|nr:hypothetical protein [Betaproteobacteria bacterium]